MIMHYEMQTVVQYLIFEQSKRRGEAEWIAPHTKQKALRRARRRAYFKKIVEDRGFEPLTFWLPARRSPN